MADETRKRMTSRANLYRMVASTSPATRSDLAEVFDALAEMLPGPAPARPESGAPLKPGDRVRVKDALLLGPGVIVEFQTHFDETWALVRFDDGVAPSRFLPDGLEKLPAAPASPKCDGSCPGCLVRSGFAADHSRCRPCEPSCALAGPRREDVERVARAIRRAYCKRKGWADGEEALSPDNIADAEAALSAVAPRLLPVDARERIIVCLVSHGWARPTADLLADALLSSLTSPPPADRSAGA